ncbi:pectin acetylesterase-family hydrolase [Nannocystis sp. ILAH1]|uniref:pectin acetylesterase-family hydrolase n=1 Tax=unclassified Nannocystis TaxID=2627009 RepID=UPI00226EE2DC|nr:MULTISPECIES: pectin acetylesterase-family hydrolase [unclassified Nannocystis]MCY0990523.1 pectin acetylesterase-family hydrolase [Nannocystis sp. ILAH1]MCY1072095.1 pectin acetylesterase-family hydrolase [Nannocystis sp. RBIL2]
MLTPVRRLAVAPLWICALLPACGDSGGVAGSDSETAGTSETTTDGGTDGTATDDPTTSAGPTTIDEPNPTTGDPTTPGTSEGTTDGTTAGTTDGATDGTTGDPPPPSPWDGEPLPDAPPGEWNWIDFPEALCRDGSSTGIGVRYGTGDGLVIYFQGGGACFNALTCAQNPSSFDGGDFDGSNNGIFDPGPQNPVGDWTHIFVPYCTGDVHAGNRPDQDSEAGVQQFVGFRNVAAYLERVVPTFTDVGHVLVTGESAGGFGAAFNYDRIADAFPEARVTLLDDSGPPLGFEVAPLCLQQKWSDLWGFDDTIPAGCQDCFPSQGGGIINIGAYIAGKHADQRLALISSTGDSVIRFFFGFGGNDCTALLPNTPQAAFEAALIDARDNYYNEPAGVWGTFFVDNSEQHTFLGSSLYSAKVGDTPLVDWVADLIAGQAVHVGP